MQNKNLMIVISWWVGRRALYFMKTKSRTLLNKITRIFSIDKELALNGKFSEKLMMEIVQENNVKSERNNNKFNNKLFYILDNIE